MNLNWMLELALGLKISSDAQWYLYIGLFASVIGISGAIIIVMRASKDWILIWNAKKKKEYLTWIMTEEYINWEKETLRGIYRFCKDIQKIVVIPCRIFKLIPIPTAARAKHAVIYYLPPVCSRTPTTTNRAFLNSELHVESVST